MHKKGQMGVGMFVMLLVVIVVGMTLFVVIAQQVGSITKTSTYNSSTGDAKITWPANAASVDLEGQEYISDFIAINVTDVIAGGNYTISEIVSTDTGVKTISLQADSAENEAQSVNVSYVYGPDGYIDNSGARSVTVLIILMFALAVAVVTMEPTLRALAANNLGI